MGQQYIISIDHGTTGSRVFCFDTGGKVISSAYREFTQYFPKPGWVEHDPEEIWAGILSLIDEALKKKGLKGSDAVGIGITNQRETVLIWEKNSGKPVYNAIVWQCRRTADLCQALKDQNREETIRNKTGLVVDAYFSATKLQWLLENVPGLRSRAERGEVICGTMDTFLLYKLTGKHRTDYTNASRTLIYNIQEKKWDDELLKLFGNIPPQLLPEVCPSRYSFGTTTGVAGLPDGIPVLSMIGDQQAAAFGQLRTRPGEAKNTYGTGCFLLLNTGKEFHISKAGLLTTLACDENGDVCYALEGAVFIAGAVIQWLRDYLKFFATATETDDLMLEIKDEEDNIVVVPAFVGLGAPHWDMNARGAIFGLTRDSSPERITRAALKSIALQSHDLVRAMESDTGTIIENLRVDGGASANNYLMQYQANILNCPVEKPENIDTTALGAAYLAGIEAGIWKNSEELKKLESVTKTYRPSSNEEWRKKELHYWNKAISRVQNWEE